MFKQPSVVHERFRVPLLCFAHAPSAYVVLSNLSRSPKVLMKSLLKLFTASVVLAMPCYGQSSGIAPSSSVAVYLQSGTGTTVCSFLATAASYSLTNTPTTGTGAGKATVSPLTVVKGVDNCSSTLLYDAAAAIVITRIFVVIAPPAGTTGQSTYVLTTSGNQISEFTDATSKKLKLEETVAFSYQDLAVAETSGTSIVGNCYGYSVTRNAQDQNGCSAITTFLNSRPTAPTTY